MLQSKARDRGLVRYECEHFAGESTNLEHNGTFVETKSSRREQENRVIWNAFQEGLERRKLFPQNLVNSSDSYKFPLLPLLRCPPGSRCDFCTTPLNPSATYLSRFGHYPRW